MFDTDYRLQDLEVDGQLSNLSRPRSGHFYFTLRDEQAALQCVMWSDQVTRMTYRPCSGDRVLVRGHLSVYEAGGRYQLYAEEMKLAGVGDLLQQVEELKRKLATEGLFETNRKLSLPKMACRIAVVTSPTGAAIEDVINVIRRRWPLTELLLVPTLVQGESAAVEIVAALRAAIQHIPDVILLVRGGGSIEDLWAFNDEGVARAIVASEVPVVTGVGHETDFTIADLASDMRAPTPSAAAELATPEQREVRLVLDQRCSYLASSQSRRVRSKRHNLEAHLLALGQLSPISKLGSRRRGVARLANRQHIALHHTLSLRRERYLRLVQSLSNLGPATTLARGYAIVTQAETNKVIRRGADVQLDEELDVRVSEGQFGVRVTRPKSEE